MVPFMTDVSRIAGLPACMDESKLPPCRASSRDFGLIEAMQAVDTTGVAPTSHPQDASACACDDGQRKRPPRRRPHCSVKTAFTWCPR